MSKARSQNKGIESDLSKLISQIERVAEKLSDSEDKYISGLDRPEDYDIQQSPYGEELARLAEANDDLREMLTAAKRVSGPLPDALAERVETAIAEATATFEDCAPSPSRRFGGPRLA